MKKAKKRVERLPVLFFCWETSPSLAQCYVVVAFACFVSYLSKWSCALGPVARGKCTVWVCSWVGMEYVQSRKCGGKVFGEGLHRRNKTFFQKPLDLRAASTEKHGSSHNDASGEDNFPDTFEIFTENEQICARRRVSPW